MATLLPADLADSAVMPIHKGRAEMVNSPSPPAAAAANGAGQAAFPPPSTHHHHQHAAAATDGDAAHVTWDEETIALHDKERGTRMKIEEPKTPYHYYGADGGVSPARSLSGKEDAPPIEWSELQVKLAHVETKQQDQQQKSEWDTSDEEGGDAATRFAARDAEGKKLEKDPRFADKRKSHYNEFQAMKMWRQTHPSDDDEEEEEEKDKPKA